MSKREHRKHLARPGALVGVGVSGNGKPQISRGELIVSYALTIVLMVICFAFVLLVAHYVPGM